MKEKKVIGPVIGCLLYTVLGAILYMVLAAFIGGLIDAATTKQMIIAPLLAAVFSILYAVIYQKKNKDVFDGIFKWENMGFGFLLLIPVLVFALLTLILAATITKHKMGFSVSLAASAIMAGVCEEITYRGIPAAHMMRCYNDSKKIWVVMLLTSFLFSFIHAFNILSGAAVGFTLLQLLRAFTLGMLLCAAYLRTGSIIPCIVLHFLNDFIVFFDQDMYGTGGISKNAEAFGAQDIIVGLIFAVIFAVVAIYAVRPAKREEIMQLWSKKWSKVNTPSQ